MRDLSKAFGGFQSWWIVEHVIPVHDLVQYVAHIRESNTCVVKFSRCLKDKYFVAEIRVESAIEHHPHIQLEKCKWRAIMRHSHKSSLSLKRSQEADKSNGTIEGESSRARAQSNKTHIVRQMGIFESKLPLISMASSLLPHKYCF